MKKIEKMKKIKKMKLKILTWMPILVLATLSAFVRADLPEFPDLIERIKPVVVKIEGVRQGRAAEEWRDLPPSWRWFFSPEGPDRGPGAPPRKVLGSGFILSADGYVLTNWHVVEAATRIRVILDDRREFEAEVAGSDELSDLALLKVKGRNLPAAKLGSSKKLRVGEWVLAIGSPFQYDFSVTAGIVSAKGRASRIGPGNYVPFIQVDAAVNPGNSGGPLFDMRGRVVGVNSQIYTRSGGFMGVALAIPVEVVEDVVRQLKSSGKVSRGWLGIEFQEVTRDLALYHGMDRPAGAMVNGVRADSPAARAGIRLGDIILAYRGEKISFSTDLPPLVGRTLPGTRVKALVLRDGKKIEVEIRVGELPAELFAVDQRQNSSEGGNSLNLKLVELDERTARELGVEGGLRVVYVGRGPAQSHLYRGDMLLELNGKPVHDLARFESLIKEADADDPLLFTVWRQGSRRYIALKPSG